MTDYLTCNICSLSDISQNAVETKSIRSNVRQFKQQYFTVWRCPQCHSLHSKETIDLTEYYANYPIGQQQLDYFTKCAYGNRLKLLLKSGLSLQDEILDFGCNQGLFMTFLKENGYQNVFGYDAYVNNYSDTAILDKKYDYITCQDVIEHVDEPSATLLKLIKSLKKNGILVIGTPNAEKIDLAKPEYFLMELHQPYHRHILSEQSLINLGKSLGLQAIKVSRRWYNDTFFPGVNTRFSWTYARCLGNDLDVFFDPPQTRLFLTSPQLLFYAFAGYFFPPSGNMIIVFKN